MKKLLFVVVALFAVLASQGKSEYDVYLLIGQSNMAGRAAIVDSLKGAIDGVWLLDDKGEIVPASHPLNAYSTIRKELGMQQVGPGAAFAQKVVAQTGRQILLVVNARGGSSIEEWTKGNDEMGFFEQAVTRAKQAQKYGKIKAVLWHQGESNNNNIEEYMPKLEKFVGDLRAALGNKKLPFIAGEIGQWTDYGAKVNEVLGTIPDYILYSACISSDDAPGRASKTDPHFGIEGQYVLGGRYADKVLEMVY